MAWLGLLPGVHSAITRTLGETVELLPSGGGSAVSVQGVYKAPPLISDEVGGVDIRQELSEVTVKSTDLPAGFDRGATATIMDRGAPITLKVIELVPDGQGLTTIWCKRAG